MLQWINDRFKKIGWILIAPMALSFAVWGVHGIVDFSSKRDQGLRVNGEDVNPERVRRAYQQELVELNRRYPDDLPAAVRASTQKQIVDEFVNTKLIEQKTKQLNYTVTDADVIDSVKSYQGFQVAGEFNKSAYEIALRSQGYTPERFEAEQRDLLKARALEGGLMVSSFALPQELAEAAALRGETRELSYVTIPLTRFIALAKPDQAKIESYYEAHKALYKTPESVHLAYVALKVDDIAREVAVDEAGLRGYFDSVKERFLEPEKRHARHILIQTGSDDAAAHKKADEVYALATKPGADFAALARQYSQDAGSKAAGGDLGWAEKSFFVGAFADAVFGMHVGEIKGPIKTPFGWHVVQLEEIAPGKSKTFDQVRAEIEPEYRKTEAERRFSERQEQLEQLAFEQNGSLEPIVKAMNLKVEEIAEFKKGAHDNALSGNQKLEQAVFSADVLGGQNSKAIELTSGVVVVVRATDHKLPQQEPLDAVRTAVEAGARDLEARAALSTVATKVVDARQSGLSWDAALKPVGVIVPAIAQAADKKPLAADALILQAPKFVARHEPSIPPELSRAVFQSTAPKTGSAVYGHATLGNGNAVVYAITAVKPGEFNPASVDSETRQTSRTVAMAELQAYLALLRARSEVHFNPRIFE